jgi:hypothetical protein
MHYTNTQPFLDSSVNLTQIIAIYKYILIFFHKILRKLVSDNANEHSDTPQSESHEDISSRQHHTHQRKPDGNGSQVVKQNIQSQSFNLGGRF